MSNILVYIYISIITTNIKLENTNQVSIGLLNVVLMKERITVSNKLINKLLTNILTNITNLYKG